MLELSGHHDNRVINNEFSSSGTCIFFRYTQWYILHFRQRDFKVEETRPALTIQNFIICVKVLFMIIYNLSFVLFMIIYHLFKRIIYDCFRRPGCRASSLWGHCLLQLSGIFQVSFFLQDEMLTKSCQRSSSHFSFTITLIRNDT